MNDLPAPEGQPNRRDELLKYRDELVRNMEQEIGRYDRAVLLVAGTFLTFSVSFLRIDHATHSWLLLTGWALLTAALMGSLGGNLLSWSIFGQEAERVSAYCRGEETPKRSQTPRSWQIVTWLNVGTGVLLGAGITFVVAFVFLNVSGGSR